MNRVFLAAALALSLNAQAATAFFTGRSQQVQSVTYQMVWNCEYSYAGRNFWMTFKAYCPSSVEIE